MTRPAVNAQMVAAKAGFQFEVLLRRRCVGLNSKADDACIYVYRNETLNV